MTSRIALPTVANVLESFELEQVDDATWRGASVPFGSSVVFGGQLIGQALVAANRAVPEKKVKSIHTVFARAGSVDDDVELEVEVLHVGRTFASASVTCRQNDRLLSRSTVLLDVAEEDVARHQADVPDTVDAARSTRQVSTIDGWDFRYVGGVDLDDPAAVGPPELNVWTRFEAGPQPQVLNQALLGWASDGFLIGTAMRPHLGIGQSMSHRELSTGVITHTLTFHEYVAASDWLLLAHRSDHAGAGRAFGRADVFTRAGVLVAGFEQEAMIRRPVADTRSAL